MKNLIDTLTEKTQDLKTEYLANTKIWAEKNYGAMYSRLTWSVEDWCEYFNLTPVERMHGYERIPYLALPDGFYNSKAARVQDRMLTEARSVTNKGLDAYIEKELGKARVHYFDSIAKLVFRLNAKGITEKNTVEIITARVAMNFEVTIKHEKGVTRAWTIIASGSVQRPHYRYLVK